jgi:hypothetical protein
MLGRCAAAKTVVNSNQPTPVLPAESPAPIHRLVVAPRDRSLIVPTYPLTRKIVAPASTLALGRANSVLMEFVEAQYAFQVSTLVDASNC